MIIRESEAISLDRVHRSPGSFSLFGKTVNDSRFCLLSSLLSLYNRIGSGRRESRRIIRLSLTTPDTQVRCVRSHSRSAWYCDMEHVILTGDIVVKMSSHITSVVQSSYKQIKVKSSPIDF